MSKIAPSSHLSSAIQQQLLAVIEHGLPLVTQPYLAIAEQIGTTEAEVISILHAWQQQGFMRRFGLVVRHRKLGYCANAMVVWNVADKQVPDVANKLAKESVVTLCYQRPRVLPQWPYNLFCMIHGKSKDEVLQQLNELCQRNQLDHLEKNVLFSSKAYKQHGARFGQHSQQVNNNSFLNQQSTIIKSSSCS